jgi:hypothetical protein
MPESVDALILIFSNMNLQFTDASKLLGRMEEVHRDQAKISVQWPGKDWVAQPARPDLKKNIMAQHLNPEVPETFDNSPSGSLRGL